MSCIISSQWTRAHGTLLLAVSLEPKEIGQRIAAARVQKGWTQLAFALEAAVSPSTVTRWESGKLPPVRELIRVAELLDVSPDDLVDPGPDDEAAERVERLEAELVEVRRSLGEIREMRESLSRIEALLLGDADAVQRR